MTAAKAGAARKPRTTAKTPDTDTLLDDPAVVLVSSDLRELTNGQIEDVEDRIEDTINRFFDQTYRRGTIHRAIAYVVRKAADPALTWEQSADLKLCVRLVADIPPTSESA